MSRAGFHVCPTCGGRYRGSWTVHAGTKKHRAATRGPRDSRIRLKPKKSYRPPPVWKGEGIEDVRAHRRRRPLDGPRKSVRVRRYGREHFQRWITHIGASGIARKIRVRANL